MFGFSGKDFCTPARYVGLFGFYNEGVFNVWVDGGNFMNVLYSFGSCGAGEGLMGRDELGFAINFERGVGVYEDVGIAGFV